MYRDNLCPPSQHWAAMLEHSSSSPQSATKVQFISKRCLFGKIAAPAAIKSQKGSQKFTFKDTHQVFHIFEYVPQLDNFL